MKNGVAIQSRMFIAASNTPTTINTPANAFVAGDIIDFIVDAGSQNNWDCDDTALEITLTYQYTKIPTPVITTTPINCSTEEIEGTTAYVSEGTIARIYDGTTQLYSTNVVLDPILYIGNYSFTGIDLTKCGGKNLLIILSKSGDIDSDGATFLVQNDGCELNVFSPPVITSVDLCNVKYDYQIVINGTSNENGDILIFEYPYISGNPVIATGIATSSGWSVSSSNISANKKYVAFLLSYEDTSHAEVSITDISCDLTPVLVGVLKGDVDGVTNGVIRIFENPIEGNPNPIINGVILNGKFDIKTNLFLPNIEYILLATKIN